MKAKRAAGSMTDDDVIDLIIDTVLGGSKRLRKLSKRIAKTQRQLRPLVNDDAWKVYLHLEELANERASVQMELLARWAAARTVRQR